VNNQGAIFSAVVPEYSRLGLIRSRELGDLLAITLGKGDAAMMRGHGITTAYPEVRAATVAACYLEESAALQLRMLAAVGGNASRRRTFTPRRVGPPQGPDRRQRRPSARGRPLRRGRRGDAAGSRTTLAPEISLRAIAATAASEGKISRGKCGLPRGGQA
jgi:hypothetical protein